MGLRNFYYFTSAKSPGNGFFATMQIVVNKWAKNPGKASNALKVQCKCCDAPSYKMAKKLKKL